MKVHKLTFVVIDFDGVGFDAAARAVRDARYPNDCIAPIPVSGATWEIGEWRDDHPLNLNATHDAAVRELLASPPETTYGDSK